MCSLALFALDPSKVPASYQRQTWQTESGLPQNTVHAITQTHDGFVWLGTEGGVVKFDGLKFAVFDSQNTPALHSNNIRALLEDRFQALWIATADGLTVFQASGSQVFTTAQGLPSNSVWSIYQDYAGGLWVITAEGIAAYHGGRFEAYRPNEKTPTSISAIAEDKQGVLWLGTQEGLRWFANGHFSAPSLAGELPTGTSVDALLADRQGRIWIGTPAGLWLVQDGKSKKYSLPEGASGKKVHALYEDREGSVWLSNDSGLARISGGKVERFNEADAPSTDIVLTMFEDREGDFWFGTEAGGMTVLRDQKFTTVAPDEGLADGLVRCIYEDSRGELWFGTNNGLTHWADGHALPFTTQSGLSSNLVFALGENAAGDLLAGTPDGLNIIHDGRVSLLTSADGLADDFVRSLYSDADGSTWIGTRSGLTHWSPSGFKTYTKADGLGSDFVGSLLRDHEGSLWIGTLQGLTQFKDGKFRTYSIASGLSSNIVTALYADLAGALWIGTQDGGLNRMRGEKLFHYPASTGLPLAIYGILEDSSGFLWLTSKSGIYRVVKKELDAMASGTNIALSVTQYGTADGLRVNECSEGGHPEAWRAKDGTLWFATLRGASSIDPRSAQSTPPPPPVAIEKVSIDDRTIDMSRDRDIAPGPERFSFEYTGLSFVSPQRVRFRYRLDGFDKDWIDAGTRRAAYYTSLPPGGYRFLVAGRANDGSWSNAPASFEFRLRPHFYQTYWFYVSLLAAAAMLAYAIYRWRVAEVEAQFNAVLAERNRIAREIHDTLAQGFVAVSLQLELIARKLENSPEMAKELIQKTKAMVLDNLVEARRSIWELRSAGNGTQDFAAKLSQMASQVAGRSGLKVQFQVLGAYRPLPEKIEDELLKIGQEAVTNVVRHANAQLVKIDLAYDSTKVRMTITDDGAGFAGPPESAGPTGHFGLRGMRERANQIGADIAVKSAPGEGTRIDVEKIVQ